MQPYSAVGESELIYLGIRILILYTDKIIIIIGYKAIDQRAYQIRIIFFVSISIFLTFFLFCSKSVKTANEASRYQRVKKYRERFRQ